MKVRRISARGTRRRLQALACIGWGLVDVSKAMGMKTSRPLYKIRTGEQKNVNSDTAYKIAVFYEEHCMTVLSGRYPDEIKAEALSKNWVAPLGWDDIDRDNHPVI